MTDAATNDRDVSQRDFRAAFRQLRKSMACVTFQALSLDISYSIHSCHAALIIIVKLNPLVSMHTDPIEPMQPLPE